MGCRACIARQQVLDHVTETLFGQEEPAYATMEEEEVEFWKSFFREAKEFVILQALRGESVPFYSVPPSLMAKYRNAVDKYHRRLNGKLGLLEILIWFQYAESVASQSADPQSADMAVAF